ncbi:unnamed protein product [Alopecurus aequalis]
MDNSSLLGWFSRHCPLPPSSLPSFLQPPIPPSHSSSLDHHPATTEQGVGSKDEGGGEEEIEPASMEEEATVGGGFNLSTARIFNEVLMNLPGWFSLPSSSLPPSPQRPQAPIPPSMATPSPSPSLHISDVDLPRNPGHADMEEMEEPRGDHRDVVFQEVVDHDTQANAAAASAEKEQDKAADFQMEAEPAAASVAHMGMMRKVKLPGRRRLCKLSNICSDQDQLQDVGTSSWEVEDPTRDCVDVDIDAVAVAEEEEQEQLPEFDMEDVDTDAVAVAEEEEQEQLPEFEMKDVDTDVVAEEEEQEQLPDFEMEYVDTDAVAVAAIGSDKPTYKLQASIFNKLYTHQREGLIWLWSLHCKGTGGVLGDDMGLGKTMQVSAFLAGLFQSGLIRRVLVVAPPTILTNWFEELSVVGLRHKIRNYRGTNKRLRNSELQHAFKEGGILLTTYDMVRDNYRQIRGDFYGNEDEGEMWNYVILDEAHFIKNFTAQRSQRLLEIPCVHRIAISGTIIQNNLKEMWSVFSFCCPEVLRDMDEFRGVYEGPINKGNDKSASNEVKHIGSNAAKELRERIEPYFLHRMKSEVFADDKQFPKKNELIIWLKLTDRQRQLYKAFLKCELVHLAASLGKPLAAITALKQICDHPQIVPKRAAEHNLEGMDGLLNNQEMEMAEKMAMKLADLAHDDDSVEVGPEVSCKLSFILALLRNLLEERHHVLIFSQSCKMLNLIQEAILLEGYNFLRMDGSTKISERERIVKDFQEGLGAQIFLLTTKVGGLGLTLTKAARVIVVGPDWNPSTDNQCVDRVYRIGQPKDVIVYRLMTSGTVEEKMYKSQVLKCALFRTVTEKNEHKRYFSHIEVQDPFSLPEQGFDVSLTQKQLQEEHGHPPDMDESLREHIEFLEQQGIAGVSYHSLLFSKEEVMPMLSEDDALGRGADPNSKDECVVARTNKISESPEEINRLAETLASTTLESMLPECADQIVHNLDNEKLMVNPELSSSSEEVIC